MAANNENKPRALAGLVEYNYDSIVSRSLLPGENGNVTLFAFYKGQSLSEHTTPFDALIYVLEGEAEVVIGGEPHRLSGGDSIIMPPDVPHAVSAPADFKMLLVMIKG